MYSVPFYTLHKLMAGLLDQYQLAGNDQAFAMVKRMGKPPRFRMSGKKILLHFC